MVAAPATERLGKEGSSAGAEQPAGILTVVRGLPYRAPCRSCSSWSATSRGLILGYLMYRSGLVPRGMAILGLIAGTMLLARFVGILFGVFEPLGVVGGLMVVPEFIWELGLGIWLIVKGFNASAVASLSADPDDGVSTGVEQPAVVPSNGRVPSKV